MKLSQPFKNYFPISQGFGMNFNDYYRLDGLKGHTGIDFSMPNGTPIISPVNGTVIAISLDIQKGEGVSILSDDTFQVDGKDCKFDCIHWHLQDKSIVVKIGDKVSVGQLLGLSNNTGQSTGPHLHFSIMPLATDGSRRQIFPLNGYNGCIDPISYLNLTTKPVAPSGSDKIKELQTLLNKYGAKLVVDGKFGKLSNQALQDFIK